LDSRIRTRPVRIDVSSVALSAGGSAIRAGSDHPLTFGGKREAVLLPGASLLSDAVDQPVTAGEDLTVTLHFPEATPVETFHWEGRRSATIVPDDHISAASLDLAELTTLRLFLSDILVDASQARGTVVVLGDSITDGAGATMEAETRWPDYLAVRAAPRGVAVVNAGISGAQLLSDRMGTNALARLDRDVFAQPKIKTLILMLGINDIAWPGTPFAPDAPPMTFERLIAGYRQIAERARGNDVHIIGATLTPFAGALPGTPLAETYYSAGKDQLRRRVNDWIRTTGVFDAVLDFDLLLRDPAHPDRLRHDYDCGDHLHPSDTGGKAMADAINLETILGEKP
jgi:lysophospholipase L1-like esterase